MQIPRPVEVYQFSSLSADPTEEFQVNIALKRLPAIIRGCDIGPCVNKWTVDYLKQVQPDKKVKVHKSVQPQLDFRLKNFTYETVTFGKLVEFCAEENNICTSIKDNCESVDGSECVSKPRDILSPLKANENDKYFWYLRSLGEDPRGKDVSDLSLHFPELYSDLKIPQLFRPDSFFSSVFRITSPGLQLWTHYDTCDNILIQVRGRKRVIFFPPSEALNLYLEGDKSQVIDVDNPDITVYPKFYEVERLEAILEEGDIVFIPALWFHNVTALNFSISVNVFWKNLNSELYDKKDTYGNRDLIPAQLGFRTLDKAVVQLSHLPKDYEDFYLRRMIVSIQKRLNKLGEKEDQE